MSSGSRWNRILIWAAGLLSVTCLGFWTLQAFLGDWFLPAESILIDEGGLRQIRQEFYAGVLPGLLVLLLLSIGGLSVLHRRRLLRVSAGLAARLRRLAALGKHLGRRTLATVAVAVVLAAGGFAVREWWPRQRGPTETLRALLAEGEGRLGNLVALEIRGSRETLRPLLRRALASPLPVRLEGPAASAVNASFSSDGRFLVTVSEDGAARIWNAGTGAAVTTLEGHEAAILSAAWSPDGNRVVTTAADSTARLFDGRTGRPMAVFEGHRGPVTSASFHVDGIRVVTASRDRSARIWDARPGSGETRAALAVLEGHEAEVTAASFDPRGQWVLTASADRTARVWKARTGDLIRIIEGPSEGVSNALFRLPEPDRVMIVSGDGIVRLLSPFGKDEPQGTLTAVLRGHGAVIRDARFTPKGVRVITVSGDRTVRIWDFQAYAGSGALKGAALEAALSLGECSRLSVTAEDGSERTLKEWAGITMAVLGKGATPAWTVAFSPDGARVVTAPVTVIPSGDGCRLETFEAKPLPGRPAWMRTVQEGWTAAAVTVLGGHQGPISAVAVSPEGDRAVTAAASPAPHLWNLAPNEPVVTLEGRADWLLGASMSPGGSRIAAVAKDRRVWIWDARTGERISILRRPMKNYTTLSFSPDEARILTASGDGTARIWDVRTGELITALPHPAECRFAEYSPDGSRIVTLSQDGKARIWDARTGEVRVGFEEWVTPGRAAQSPDGTRVATLSAGPEGAVRIWDPRTGEVIASLEQGAPSSRFSFSSDGSRFMTLVHRRVRVFHPETGELLSDFGGGSGPFSASPDGSRVVMGFVPMTARIWNAESGEVVATLEGHTAGISTASFSPDGSRVLTASWDETARIWDAETGETIAVLEVGTAGRLEALFSLDGSRIVTVPETGTVRIWAHPADDVRYLRGRIRARVAGCLSPEERRDLLGERAADAERRHDACDACAPLFFERLEEDSGPDRRSYEPAFRAYEECLSRKETTP